MTRFSGYSKPRLTRREDIEMLTLEKRLEYRGLIAQFTELLSKMEDRQILTQEEQDNAVLLSGGSKDSATWYNALINSLEKVEALYMGKLAKMAQHDLGAYHEFMHPEEFPAHHHRMLCADLMALESGDLKTMMLSMSPGTAKSTYGSRSFTQWAMGRNPNWSVLSGGYNQKFADNEFSKPNRDMIDSERYRLVFPDIYLSETDKGADQWKLQDFKGKFYSKGAGAGSAGIRANLTNLDDPIGSALVAKSETERDNLWKWMTTDILPRRLPHNRMLIIATRWHSEDIIGRLETIYKKEPKSVIGPVKILNIPAQAGEDDPLGRKPGEWIWPEFYPAQHFETMKLTMQPGEWSALYMGIPLDSKGDYVSEEHFKRFDRYPRNIAGQPNEVGKTIISVDTAQKATQRSNWTAIAVFRQGLDKTHYMVHGERVRAKMDDVVPLLSRLASNWNANYILIEDAGFGSQILQNYQGKMPCPLVEFSPHSKSSKEFQFENAVPYILTGLVKFPKEAIWLNDFINELVAFPDGANDDYVDAFSQYVTHSLKRQRGRTSTMLFT